MSCLLPLVASVAAVALSSLPARAETTVQPAESVAPKMSQPRLSQERATRASAAERAPLRLTLSDSTLHRLDAPRLAPASSESEVRAADLARSQVEMPWIWQRMRGYAHAKLPKHEKPNFTAVWSPMPVKTSRETVAGVGLKGKWL